MATPIGKSQYGDDIYQTPNGAKTGTQITQELGVAGWQGQGDPVEVYNSTAQAGRSGSTPPQPGNPPPVPGSGDAGALGSWIDKMLASVAGGNKQAFDEAVREYNQNFGLDQGKFNEAIRQFNVNLPIAEAGLTGTYQGQQTQAAQQQKFQQGIDVAGLTGQYQGAPTQAAQQQAYAQQLGAINAAAALQANPFRQAQVIGQLGNVLGGRPVAGFQAPGTAQGQTNFSGMGNMQRLIDDIRGGPGAVNSTTTDSVLNAIPTPTKLDSVGFMRSSPGTKNMILQGMQEKFGLDPQDALGQIQNTLPQFTAPTTFGAVKR